MAEKLTSESRIVPLYEYDEWNEIKKAGELTSRDEGYKVLEAEISALHAEGDRLRKALCGLATKDATLSVCEGNVKVTMDCTITDEERVITRAAYEGDIVSRLRNWRGLHLAHGGELFDEAASEIERLRPTDAEREAVEQAIDAANGMGQAEPAAWAVLDSRGIVCVAYICREAAEAYCEGTFNRLAPLYRQPQPCPYVTGKTTRYCTLTPFTLTDAEREAVEAAYHQAIASDVPGIANTLRGLLERMK